MAGGIFGQENGYGADPEDVRDSDSRLTTLKDFAHIAWEECRKPLAETTGSTEVRFEIYSTWILLLCLQHAETEAERCRSTWKPVAWRTEALALRHLFMEHRSVRCLTAVLRWLRWVHQLKAGTSQEMEDGEARDAKFERTRRALQTRAALPAPLQDGPQLHPDWPLQHPGEAHSQDMEDERVLLQQLWTHLRRGNLYGAQKLCVDRQQAWRTALLQGMFPFADGSEEPWYNSPDGDEDEDLLARMKEDHTDWTELGNGESTSDVNGNPWRRVWKEQCWDSAHRAIQGGSMDPHELAILGFCSGHREAMMPMCGTTWMDKCWGELHCLKEWLIEHLLAEGRSRWCEEGCSALGEGDAGVSDVLDTPEDQALRRSKLAGKLENIIAGDLEAFVAQEVRRVMAGLRCDPSPFTLQQQAMKPFPHLQAMLIEAAWAPQYLDSALELLKGWLMHGFDGEECPFLVKKFASYFAILQKSASEESTSLDVDMQTGPEEVAMPDVSSTARNQPTVDQIVRALIDDLVQAAAGSWVEQCLEGIALDYIAEHLSALSAQHRVDAYVGLLLHLGAKSDEVTSEDSIGINIREGFFLPEHPKPTNGAEKGLKPGVSKADLRAKLLQRCMWAFWDKFPSEAFALLAVLAKRTLRVEEQADAPVKEVSAQELVLNLHCLAAAWVVLRSLPEDSHEVEQSVEGLVNIVEGNPPGLEEPGDFGNLALEKVIVPLLVDVSMTLAAHEPGLALMTLEELRDSSLWRDASSCQPLCWRYLVELEWCLELHRRHKEWRAMLTTAGKQESAEDQRQLSIAKEALLSVARTRFKQEQPLLEPQSSACTALPADRWEGLRQLLLDRCLHMLLNVFQEDCDFDGAVYDLAVSVAESPWVLKLLRPAASRNFLLSLARLPAQSSN
mmetsp:Transcript_62222/g.148454  ORF Transcript_62222/g.148454 Transcript_62222/m.148454 type:complete len:901 (+) Transcript_62222:104-2806(+)